MALDEEESASSSLLAAALGGLLCLASGACTQSQDTGPAGSTTSAVAPFECDGGVVPDAGVTSGTVVPGLTRGDFTTKCDDLHGVVEIQPHCGGLNACRGMSYDTNTQVLTMHTCRGTNSCAGYTCVICD